MEQSLAEIVSACERTLAEDKSSTRERAILSTVTKSLKRYLLEAKTATNTTTTTTTTAVPERAANASEKLSPSGASRTPSPQSASEPAITATTQQPGTVSFLSRSDDLNKLAYACRVALVGEKDMLTASTQAGLPSRSSKYLTASLELATTVLNSGVLPTRLVIQPPAFDGLQSGASGAQVFFSKLLGGGGGGNSVSPRSDAAALPSNASESQKQNVRDMLVDAVFATADAVYAKEPNDKLWFVFITALVAAVVPRRSRDTASSEPRTQALQLHGPRLLRAIQILFSTFSRPNISPILVDEAKSALIVVTKAVSKHSEMEGRAASSRSSTPQPPPPGTETMPPDADADAEGREALGGDIVRVLEFCSAVARTAPLSASSSTAAAASPSVDPSLSAVQGEADSSMAPYRNYTALYASLNLMLHMSVNGGPVFRKTGRVIHCIKQHVLPSVVRTSVSNDSDIFRLSLNVLLSSCLIFGPHVVNEISMVFRHVYFRVLGSSFTSLSHKAMVIEVFQKYIEEPQHMINLFLNFDCNTHSQSLYEEMIGYLGALARPPAHPGLSTRDHVEDNSLESTLTNIRIDYTVPESLRRKALSVLLLVADSNIQWVERFETSTQVDTSVNANISRRGSLTAERDAGEDSAIALEESSGGGGGGVSASASCLNNNDGFIKARRYKDGVRRFAVLFNSGRSAEEAFNFLVTNVLEEIQPSNCAIPNTNTNTNTNTTAQASTSPSKEDDASTTPADTSSQQPAETTDAPSTTKPEASNNNTSSTSDVDETERHTASSIARFLQEHEDSLDKLVLGDFFAKSFRKVRNRLILEEWIKLHNFSGLSLDEALRLFLGGFKLLGEAQIVDMTMELFAAHYCRQNPNVFASADTAFILSFSICMLNTDSHSAHVKNKMTEQGFIRNNKGINEGDDVDPSILKGIYERITQNEIVLRPSKNLRPAVSSSQNSKEGSGEGGSTLESIPILRHLRPIAVAFTDKVLLPIDFGFSQRRRDEICQEELKAALQDVMEGLHQASDDTSQSPSFVMATSIEHALPMWEVTVSVLCRLLSASLLQLFEEAEQYKGPPGSQDKMPPDFDPVSAYMRDTHSADYFQILLRGLQNTTRVCCSFGNVDHTETMLEQCLELTQLSQTVVFSSSSGKQMIHITQVISRPRLELLSAFLTLYVKYGNSFSWRGWQAGYTALSLLDALANGMDGMWRRQTNKMARATDGNNNNNNNTSISNKPSSSPQPAKDMWFGQLREVPPSISSDSFRTRSAILGTIRSFPTSAVDLWLDHLFDATEYATATQIQMANALVKVCEKELQHGRTFSLSKLFDFVSTCASFSSRLQWRDLWANASVVFIKAGTMRASIAGPVVDGLRIIALTYLMREELLNYSFQKEVLKPFEEILMSNQDVAIRRKIIAIFSELIDLRAEHLASAWIVVFSCLSHAAVIPEVVELAWEVCERVMVNHIRHVKDCFSDLIFCLTAFACTSVTERVPLRGISYLVCCGHWLQYGLDAPPSDVREAAEVVQWASRFRTANQEAAISQSLGKNLVRVALSAKPLTTTFRLEKPASYCTKTHYHLWISLFEGMVPILVVHSSVRVRAHAVCSLWSLLRQYGGAFTSEVQDSLFHSMLRPVLNTLLTHVPSSGSDGGGSSSSSSSGNTFDKSDYRMLIYLALRGMILACTDDAHLLELCCSTLKALLSNRLWSMAQISNDLVDVCVRVCCDFLAAPYVPSASSPMSTPGPAPAAAETKFNSSFLFNDANSSATPSWLQQPVAVKKDASPFFLGLLHEVLQIGFVDVVNYKRTASWVELHRTPAASATSITLSSKLQTISIQSMVRETVLHCLSSGLMKGLQNSIKAVKDDRSACLGVSRAMRRSMLGVSFYCVATQDMDGLSQLLDAASACSEAEGPACSAVEMLLVIPYACVLVEFIFSFPMLAVETPVAMIEVKLRRFLQTMEVSRQFCIEQQRHVQAAFEEKAVAAGTRVKAYKGRSFIDIFRCGRTPLSHRKQYLPADAPSQLRQRVFHEWRYLNYLLGIRCALTMGQHSVLASCISPAELFDVVGRLPSATEEGVASEFIRGCWEELDLHCGMPEDGTMSLCLSVLQERTQLGVASLSSSSI